MKNILKLVIAFAIAAMCSNVSAQTVKLAHINMQDLIESMPEYETAMETFQIFVQELENELEEMNVELNRLWDNFQRTQEGLTDIVRQNRIEEIQIRQQRVQAFQQQAEESAMMEQGRIMQPIIERANDAIETVARAQEITYVITDNPQILLFKGIGAIDLLPAVRQHLGIR